MACSVLSRFSADPWSDVIAQAEAVEADVVLVDRAFAERAPVRGRAPVDPAFTLAVVGLGGATA